jgi:hypothetical protein
VFNDEKRADKFVMVRWLSKLTIISEETRLPGLLELTGLRKLVVLVNCPELAVCQAVELVPPNGRRAFVERERQIAQVAVIMGEQRPG